MHTEDRSSAAGPTSTSFSWRVNCHTFYPLAPHSQTNSDWVKRSISLLCHKASLESHGNTLTPFLSKGCLKCTLSPGKKKWRWEFTTDWLWNLHAYTTKIASFPDFSRTQTCTWREPGIFSHMSMRCNQNRARVLEQKGNIFRVVQPIMRSMLGV